MPGDFIAVTRCLDVADLLIVRQKRYTLHLGAVEGSTGQIIQPVEFVDRKH